MNYDHINKAQGGEGKMGFLNESGLDFVDISTEAYRVYEFPNGDRVRIDLPMKLNVSRSGGHRVYDESGESHYIPPKWIHLSWRAKDGNPNFVK